MTDSDDRPKKDNYGLTVSEDNQTKLLVIVGPTASGKSDLAMEVAKKLKGEIICADSRTIYKGMDIGTAKPSLADRKAVPHWGLDLLEPGKKFSAAAFKKYAEAKITDIQKRGLLPIVVGGTGLYVDSVLFDFDFPEPKRMPLRHRLFYPWWSIEKLQKTIQQRDWPMPENSHNRRHLLNTVRRHGQVGNRQNQPRPDALIVGLMPPDDVLKARIAARADKLLQYGIIEETRRLMQQYGHRAIAGTAGIAYGEIIKLIKNQAPAEQAIARIKSAEWQYARRQKTWFKRNKFIKWFSSPTAAFDYISSVLNT